MLGLCMFLTLLMLLFSAKTMVAAQQAAAVFARSVMPALFPMMIVGSLIACYSTVSQKRIKYFLSQIMFGFMAGSPASTKQLSMTLQHQTMPQKDYNALLCMSGVMSPMFFTGVLASRLGSGEALMMLCCHWAAALLTGSVYIWFSSNQLHKEDFSSPKTISKSASPSPTFAAALTGAIREAALAQLSVLGAMMVFSILAALIRECFAHLFPLWTASHDSWLAVGWSLLEVGGGILALLDSTPATPPWLICGLCSFGGLSIWLQNLLFLDAKTPPAELLGFRTLHGVLAMFLCAIVQAVFR